MSTMLGGIIIWYDGKNNDKNDGIIQELRFIFDLLNFPSVAATLRQLQGI